MADDDLEQTTGTQALVEAFRASVGPKPVHEAVAQFNGLLKLSVAQRQSGEGMRTWTNRFRLQVDKVGRSLNQAEASIDPKECLHPLIRGMLRSETCGLTASEFAAVLATSGKTGETGTKLGNSWREEDLIEA